MPGYVCPPNSTVSSSLAMACGNVTVFCPAGTTSPRLAQDGYYTEPLNVTANVRYMETECPRGSYCIK